MRIQKTLVIIIALGMFFTIAAVIYGLINSYVPAKEPVLNEEIIEEPYIEFSSGAGFYDRSFMLNINAKGDVGQIYYTTDCSKPDKNDKPYNGEGISLDIEPGKEKVYTIRAVGFKDEQIVTKETVATYILNENCNSRYTTAVISLITENSNLNNRKTGIFSQNNYLLSGMEYERDIHLEYFTPDGALVLSQHGGVRLFGGASRGIPQKSLRLYARKQYDTTGTFIFNPLENQRGRFTGKFIFEFQKYVVRNSGNDWCSSHIRDALMQKMADRTVVDYQDYRPMTVYLNGKYNGILNYREDTNSKYFENHYGVPEEGVSIISSHLQVNVVPGDTTRYVLDEGNIEELNKWNSDLNFVISGDMTDEKNYKQACSLFDMENFSEYMLLQIYYANTDWPQNNLRMWRYNPYYDPTLKPVSNGFDGKWRFILKDTDFGLHLYDDNNVKHNTLLHAVNSGDMFGLGKMLKNLLKNEEFKQLFITSACDLLNYTADIEYIEQLITEMQVGISQEVPYHFKKWRSGNTKNELAAWDASIERMRDFIRLRPQYLTEYIKRYFKLEDEVILTVEGSEFGTVYINDIPISGDTTKYYKYFPGMSLKLSYKAKPGYMLSQYNITEEIEYYGNSIILKGNALIEPVFVKDESYKKTLVINEYMSSSTKAYGYDWVEIYNCSDHDISLNDYFLTDNTDNIDKWQFPGFTLKSGEYIVIKFTGTDKFTGYDDIQVNFKISQGETLSIVYRDGTVIESITIEDMFEEIGGNICNAGRYPDAHGDFIQLISSPGKANIYNEYTLYIHPTLYNRVIINGELKDSSYSTYVNEGEPYINISGTVYNAKDYAAKYKLTFVYVYRCNTIVFSKK